MSRDEKQKTSMKTLNLPSDLHQRLKLVAVKNGKQLTVLLAEIVEQYLESHEDDHDGGKEV